MSKQAARSTPAVGPGQERYETVTLEIMVATHIGVSIHLEAISNIVLNPGSLAQNKLDGTSLRPPSLIVRRAPFLDDSVAAFPQQDLPRFEIISKRLGGQTKANPIVRLNNWFYIGTHSAGNTKQIKR